MAPWTREHTRAYLEDEEYLVKALLAYKQRAQDFCRERGIENPETIIAAIVMSSAWVYDKMDLYLTAGMCPDILDIPYNDQDNTGKADSIVSISRMLAALTHDELLEAVTEAMI